MPLESPVVAAPMVRPDNAMVQVELAGSCIIVEMTKLVVVLDENWLEAHPLTEKETEVSKKLDGNVSVMWLPYSSSPTTVVVNENVAAAPLLPAMRSESAIVNFTFAT